MTDGQRCGGAEKPFEGDPVVPSHRPRTLTTFAPLPQDVVQSNDPRRRVVHSRFHTFDRPRPGSVRWDRPGELRPLHAVRETAASLPETGRREPVAGRVRQRPGSGREHPAVRPERRAVRRRREHREQAHLPAEQSPPGEDARIPAAHADACRPRDPGCPPPQGPDRAVGLTPARVRAPRQRSAAQRG